MKRHGRVAPVCAGCRSLHSVHTDGDGREGCRGAAKKAMLLRLSAAPRLTDD